MTKPNARRELCLWSRNEVIALGVRPYVFSHSQKMPKGVVASIGRRGAEGRTAPVKHDYSFCGDGDILHVDDDDNGRLGVHPGNKRSS